MKPAGQEVVPDVGDEIPRGDGAHPHETTGVGKTVEDQERNARLLADYQYEEYPVAITGFTGQDLQCVEYISRVPATRVRVGPRGNFKSALAQLPDGKLVVAVCRYNNAEDPRQKVFDVHVYESGDLGCNWQEIGRTPLFGKEPSMAALPGGGLVLITHGAFFAQGPNQAHHIASSIDGGRTWDVGVLAGHDYPRSFVTEPDGSLLIISARDSSWTDATKGSPNLLVRRSTDRGKTWDVTEGLVDWNWPGFGEVAAIRLKDGRLLAALRRQIPGTTGEGFQDTVLTESTDDGGTWSRPWQLTATAQVHAYLSELHDGRILCTYSNYHVPYGTSAVLSEDKGRHWNLDNPIRLATSAGIFTGWGSTLQLEDDSLVTCYAVSSYDKWQPRMPAVYQYGGHQAFDIVTSEVVRWRLA